MSFSWKIHIQRIVTWLNWIIHREKKNSESHRLKVWLLQGRQKSFVPILVWALKTETNNTQHRSGLGVSFFFAYLYIFIKSKKKRKKNSLWKRHGKEEELLSTTCDVRDLTACSDLGVPRTLSSSPSYTREHPSVSLSLTLHQVSIRPENESHFYQI